MRINIRFRKKDPDLCKWRHAINGRLVSFYINNILEAEINHRIAYLPQTVLLSMDDTPCEVNFRVRSEEIEAFLLSIPNRQRNAVIKDVIRKHLRAQSDIKTKSSSPFAKDVQMAPQRTLSETVSVIPVPSKQTIVKSEKAVEPKTKEISKSEPQPGAAPEAREETDEEREMRMALIAMAGE